MVLLESKKISMGESAHDFNLVAIDGRSYSLVDFENAKVLVVVFMCNHCPYVQRIWANLVDLAGRLMDKNVQFVGINPNFHPDYPEETMENMKKYYAEYKMNFPYLLDESQGVARAYNAQCTPDIYVYNYERKLAYHGRIEDDELENAINLILKNQEPSKEQRPSIGCSIKWRD